jgi:hypothetical protein
MAIDFGRTIVGDCPEPRLGPVPNCGWASRRPRPICGAASSAGAPAVPSIDHSDSTQATRPTPEPTMPTTQPTDRTELKQ